VTTATGNRVKSQESRVKRLPTANSGGSYNGYLLRNSGGSYEYARRFNGNAEKTWRATEEVEDFDRGTRAGLWLLLRQEFRELLARSFNGEDAAQATTVDIGRDERAGLQSAR
jgi:hypothetical protein